jgi:exoribonuclease R
VLWPSTPAQSTAASDCLAHVLDLLLPLMQALLADTQGVDADASRRRDLRHLTTFAVDDAGTSEVDDAVSWEELPWGGTKLWVHVADPTRWLTIGRSP